MKWNLVLGLMVSLSGMTEASAKDSGRKTEYRVSAHMTRKVDVSPTLLRDSQKAATAIFTRIRVQLAWTDECSRACKNLTPSTGASAIPDIAVEIVAHAPDSFKEESLAMALPYADSGVRVVIFYDRVAPYLRNHHAPAETILGYVLAHEIAHVLQGVARHSDSGVMRARWTDLDYQWMSKGALRFATEDVQLIRHHLLHTDSTTAPGPLTSKP